MTLATRLGGHLQRYVIPDRPTLALRERPRARAHEPRARAPLGRRARWPSFWGVEHPALPQPALDAAGVARVPRATSGRDWMLNSGVLHARPRAPVDAHPRGQRRDLRDLPAVALARLPARAAMSAPRFPAVAAPPRPLRVLLPARGRPGERPLGLDPPHRLQAPGRPGDRRAVVHAVRRRRSPSRARSSSRCPDPRAGDWLDLGPSHIGPRARAAAPRRRAAARPGSSASAPPPSRCATSPTRSSTTRPSRARRRRARCPTRRSPAGSRRTASAGSSTRGPGWSATTGAPSTPSAGSGCTASASTARPTRGSTSRSAASASAR